MLMSAVIHYFAGGYSTMALPIQINSAMTTYVVPILVICGLALTLYGVFLRVKA
jgi:hypothetical protein